MNFKKSIIVACTVAMSVFSYATISPEFEIGSKDNPTAIYIQRSMKAMEESTKENPATIRVLFYGQSIVAQGWRDVLAEKLKEKYPTVNFIFKSKAIGGFESPNLCRTAWSDLYPFYPDLLFFHVYGPIDKYEEIVKNVRKMTTAEIVLWTSHLNTAQDPKGMLKKRDQRSLDILEVAKRNKCTFIDLNKKWCELLVVNGWKPSHLLRDFVHLKGKGSDALKYYAGFIGEELCRIKGTDGEEDVSGTITEIPAKKSKNVQILPDGTIKLRFKGNRVVAVSDGKNFNPADNTEAELFLDGKSVASYPEMWYCTRPSTLVSWMPMIKCVRCEAAPVKEDWTLTFLEGTDIWGDPVHFKVEGSVTGYDGEGWSTNAFRSTSGRVVIDKEDYHFAWQFNYFVKKKYKKDPKAINHGAKPGRKIKWKTMPLFADPFVAKPAGERSVLVQNCSNGEHVLEIRPKNGGKIPSIGKFIVYAPAK